VDCVAKLQDDVCGVGFRIAKFLRDVITVQFAAYLVHRDVILPPSCLNTTIGSSRYAANMPRIAIGISR
jgi:hypothetical protein